MPATRFPTRASGPAERLAGFIAYLRCNGIPVGPAETGRALAGLAVIRAHDPREVRSALKSLLVSSAEDWPRFDLLFDGYWLNAGRIRKRPSATRKAEPTRPALWTGKLEERRSSDAAGETPTGAADDDGPTAGDSEGRLVASRRVQPLRRDLRELMGEDEIREAKRIAERLASAIRERLSRRRMVARQGVECDLRRTIRRSLARGGEPIDLARKKRREPPLKLAVLLDVSGSMSIYSRVLLAFLKGLVGAAPRADAYLFHTRLIRVTEALAERDALEAATRLSLMAEGFGGGTRIGHALRTFNDGLAKRAINGRTAVIVLSDGYDADPPELLAAELARLRRRARRIIWLNPLAGWRDYAPVAAGMAAALPHLDAFLPANTLASLADLEAELARL
jgi:uncharacterized protein